MRCTASITALVISALFAASAAAQIDSRPAAAGAPAAAATTAAAEAVVAPPIYGDTAAYSNLLAKHVDTMGRVDYAALAGDRGALDAFLARAAALPEQRVWARWPSDDPHGRALQEAQTAFLLNVYNARVLQTVLDHYPLAEQPQTDPSQPRNSLKQVPGAFDADTFTLGGRKVTLDELENKTIRMQTSDARVQLALARGAVGSPPLRGEAYRAGGLESQLADQARRFLASPAGLRVEDGKTRVSEVFAWREADFSRQLPTKNPLKSPGEMIANFIKQYGPKDAAGVGAALAGAKPATFAFDWTLNDRPNP